MPKLGELRLLPRVEAAKAEETPVWSGRHRLISLGAIVATISIGLGVYYWLTTPDRRDYDARPDVAEVEEYFQTRNPVQTWHHWLSQTVPLAEHGLQEEITRRSEAFESQVEQGTRYQRLAFGVAGVAVLFCLAVALWRTS